MLGKPMTHLQILKIFLPDYIAFVIFRDSIFDLFRKRKILYFRNLRCDKAEIFVCIIIYALF